MTDFPEVNDLSTTWYAVPNDLIGGWCVMPEFVRPSSGCWEVGTFMSEAMATHIAGLHNAWLEAQRMANGLPHPEVDAARMSGPDLTDWSSPEDAVYDDLPLGWDAIDG